MTRRWSYGARPGRPAAAAPGEDSNGTIGEYCSGTDNCVRLEPHGPVFLDLAGAQSTEANVAEIGQQMIIQPRLVVLHVARITLAIGEWHIFPNELLGRVGEGSFLLQLAYPAFAPQLQIPVSCISIYVVDFT